MKGAPRSATAGVLLLALLACANRSEGPRLPDGLALRLPLDARFAASADRRTGSTRTLTFDAGEDRVLVRVHSGLDDAQARTRANDARFLVSDLFREKVSPYPGTVSNAIACAPEFQPVSAEGPIAGGWRASFRLLANRMRVFGVCAREDARYDAALAHVYCGGTRTLFEVKAFTPVGAASFDLDAFVAALDCGGGAAAPASAGGAGATGRK